MKQLTIPDESRNVSAEFIRRYLDEKIRYYRCVRREAKDAGNFNVQMIAAYYVDAFQSVRQALVGERFPV